MIHGGDIYSIGKKVIDFSSNINPFGTVEGFKEHLFQNFNRVEVYPDIKYRNLKKRVAEYLGVEEKNVIVGNGAVDIINNIVLMFNRVVVFIPCFIEYILRPKLYNKDVLMLNLQKDFTLDIKLIYENLKPSDLLILGNPNNPTGLRIEKNTLIEIANLVEERRAFLLLDEAFFEFCDGYDSIKELKGFKNICILRAATKFFALPGIRLGYACADEKFVKEYSKYELPWTVNAFAELAAEVIFNEGYIKKTKEYIKIQRDDVFNRLSKIKNIKPFRSDCNFMLIKLLKKDEEYIYERLLEKNILVRKCSSFYGLDNTFIRIAIKSREDNEVLIKEINNILGDGDEI
ncbi:MAG: aminotransferase class I/II-fold pyridoxal phosphate-dependent enzyme [Caloramator sp.]|nr:aminotransferase class I/II-fold pyridoxal phosphate-dependent enzyme [Caloramator sp.]